MNWVTSSSDESVDACLAKLAQSPGGIGQTPERVKIAQSVEHAEQALDRYPMLLSSPIHVRQLHAAQSRERPQIGVVTGKVTGAHADHAIRPGRNSPSVCIAEGMTRATMIALAPKGAGTSTRYRPSEPARSTSSASMA